MTCFINAAQTNSPVLNDYNNQVVAARIESIKLRATYGFIVTGEGNVSYAPVITLDPTTNLVIYFGRRLTLFRFLQLVYPFMINGT
ncbi:hypothetical protein [Niabella beijingensis]|uniref:hypothetical protein n=1 Tax=Niabella beijingensis TaxID=2872700 RepID=UPI001CC0DB29|nr:hypothetical protein [Niabella beijingensis]MBZ4192433.1 hypothetical protein [Niabella beijingensis]